MKRDGSSTGRSDDAGADEALERLRGQLAERDDLLALVAHELRNPLQALALQLALVRKGVEGAASSEEMRPRVARAEVLLARYIDRATLLLDLTRLNADAYPLAARNVDLRELLAQIAQGLAPEAQFRGVRLELDLPNAPCPAQTDPLVLEQIVDNLLLNAFKHAACREVRLGLHCTPGSGRAQIVVADDGRGIAPEDQQRIFGKFEVARSGARGSGSGLGLWIVRKLLCVLGAEIALASAPGAGTTFTLAIPLSSDPGGRPPP